MRDPTTWSPTVKSVTKSAKVGKGVLSTKTAPKISGTKKAGRTLKVSKGSDSAKPSSYGYRRYRGSSKIKGAIKSSYRVTSSDVGKNITAKVTIKRTRYTTRTVASRAVSIAPAAQAAAGGHQPRRHVPGRLRNQAGAVQGHRRHQLLLGNTERLLGVVRRSQQQLLGCRQHVVRTSSKGFNQLDDELSRSAYGIGQRCCVQPNAARRARIIRAKPGRCKTPCLHTSIHVTARLHSSSFLTPNERRWTPRFVGPTSFHLRPPSG